MTAVAQRPSLVPKWRGNERQEALQWARCNHSHAALWSNVMTAVAQRPSLVPKWRGNERQEALQ